MLSAWPEASVDIYEKSWVDFCGFLDPETVCPQLVEFHFTKVVPYLSKEELADLKQCVEADTTSELLPFAKAAYPMALEAAEKWGKSRRCVWIMACLQLGFQAEDSEEVLAFMTEKKPRGE